jgi:long-chain acyl-CoA synthetase
MPSLRLSDGTWKSPSGSLSSWHEMSLHWPIIKRLAQHLRRVALIDDQRSYRGLELLVGAFHMASEIERRCSTRTVGILLPTGGAFPMAALAAWMLGKTVVPLNYLLKQDELQYVIDDCEADTVVSAGPMLEFLGYRPRVASLIELDRLAGSFKRSVPEFRWPAPAEDEDLAILLYTSGTSGKPKGVMLTHGNVASNIRQVHTFAGFSRSDALLGVLPQFHSFGLTVLTLMPLVIGCRAIYTARFVPARIVKLIREHRPTGLVLIPSMYNALLHVKDATPDDFRSLRFVISGGEPLPRATFEGFRERFGVTINEGYGLTETSPVTNVCLPGERREGSVGRALPGIDQRIMDSNTLGPVPFGHEGEVVLRGPNVMRGYFKRPEETAKAFVERGPMKGYFRTGDIGKLDADGFLSITGRLKEMLIVGGENVFPREIEEVLNQHPAVNASGVIGLADPMRGELPVAFVEFKEGQTADAQTLQSWCRERLAGYKVPKEIRVVPALPRNPTGKIVRRELKKLMGN